MMQKLAITERGAQSQFVTLTFPDEYQPHALDANDNRAVFRRFEKRFIRAFPKAGFVWRKEYQDRKSGRHVGELFPHFHLLVWGVTCDVLRAWIGRAWWGAVGELSQEHLRAGTSVEPMRSWRGALYYISKYMAKPDSGMHFDTGRLWGFVNAIAIPFVQSLTVTLSERGAVQLMRLMRRFAHMRGRDYKSLTIFCNADLWQMAVDAMGETRDTLRSWDDHLSRLQW